jgi:hypothetical protein
MKNIVRATALIFRLEVTINANNNPRTLMARTCYDGKLNGMNRRLSKAGVVKKFGVIRHADKLRLVHHKPIPRYERVTDADDETAREQRWKK